MPRASARGGRDVSRNLEEAKKQLMKTIRYRLVVFPAKGVSVEGLTDALIEDLAGTIAAMLDEYGREKGKE